MPAYPEAAKLFDLAALRAMVWRQRYVVGGITALALLIGLVFTLLATPMYQASVSVRVGDDTVPIVEGQEITETYIPTNEVSRYMLTLGSVIESRRMAYQVVDALDLQDDEALLGEMIAAGKPAAASEEAWLDARRDAAASKIRSALSVDIPYDRRIIGIRISMANPQLATRVANGYATQFVTEDIRRGLEANAFALEFLAKEITETRQQLQEAEIEAIDYARSQRIFMQSPVNESSEGEDSAAAPSMTSSSLGMVNADYGTARTRRINSEQRWNAIASVPAMDLPEVQQDPAIQTLRTQRAQTMATLAELRQRYQDDHPTVREAMGNIEVLNDEIASSARSIKQGLRNEFVIARQQEAALSQELSGLADATLDEQDRRVQFNLLNREAEVLRSQLDSLLQRFAGVSAASNLQTSRVTILDSATVPGAPFSPNLMTNMLVALVLGAGFAVVLAVLRETFDDRFATFDDVERRIGVPMLGQTPYVPNQLEGDLDNPFSLVSEAYSSLRATIDYSLPQNSKIIQFTSTQPSEGKTTTAIAVARCFANVGQRTLLVDMDLRRPAVGTRLVPAGRKVGLIDVLLSRARLEEAVIQDADYPSLDILPVIAAADNPVAILSSGIVPQFFDRVSAHYDRIIVDSSPVLGIADAPLLARHANAVIFVMEANRTHARQVKAALRRLEANGVEVTGGVLTKYRALEAGESYSYQYNYYSYKNA